LRRYGKSRQGRVRQRDYQAAKGGGPDRRQFQDQRFGLAPQAQNQQQHHAGDHRDMEARDAHQVVYAGAREHPPLIRGNGLLVTDRKRHDDARVRPVVQRFEQMRACGFPRSFQQIGRTPHQRFDQTRRGLGADIAHCADAALQHPGFEIEAGGIGISMGSVQAHSHAPALAGMQVRRRFVVARIPHQGKPGRNPRIQRVTALHIKQEAHAAFVRLHHFRDHPRDLDIAPFPDFRKVVREFPGSHRRRPEKSGSGKRDNRNGMRERLDAGAGLARQNDP